MRTIRQILLTEYIGAIVIAMLVADSFSTLFTTAVAQISYHLYLTGHNTPGGIPRISSSYSILDMSARIALYLISAYLLARWLYPAETETGTQTKTAKSGAELQKPEGKL